MNDGFTQDSLSALELAAYCAVRTAHTSAGLPSPENVRVSSRLNTGAGRYTMLTSSSVVEPREGLYDMGGHYIELPGVKSGLLAVVSVESGRVHCIEFAVYGESHWSGCESGFTIAQ